MKNVLRTPVQSLLIAVCLLVCSTAAWSKSPNDNGPNAPNGNIRVNDNALNIKALVDNGNVNLDNAGFNMPDANNSLAAWINPTNASYFNGRNAPMENNRYNGGTMLWTNNGNADAINQNGQNNANNNGADLEFRPATNVNNASPQSMNANADSMLNVNASPQVASQNVMNESQTNAANAMNDNGANLTLTRTATMNPSPSPQANNVNAWAQFQNRTSENLNTASNFGPNHNSSGINARFAGVHAI